MKNLLIIIFVFLNLIASATDYYVSTGGNDSNTGLSPSTPWKTISKVNSHSFSPGDRIYFSKGNTWNESLTVPSSGNSGAPITFSSYGTGSNPLIDGNNSIDRCITLTGRSYIVIDGIDCKNAVSYGIASPSGPGTNITIKNLTISYIGKANADLEHAIFQQGGYLTVDHCTITRISHCGIMFGGSHNTITNNNISYTNQYFTGWGAGINGTSTNDDISYNTIDNCGGVGEATKTHGIYVHLTSSQVHHNIITHSTKGSGIKSVAGGDYHHNYISGSYLSGIETGTNGASYGGTVNIYYNIFTGNRQGVSESAQGSGAFSLHIYNNTFYYNNSTQEDSYYAELTLDENINTSLEIKNNILYGSGRYTYAIGTQSHAVINNNLVYQTGGSLVYYGGATKTWSSWQAMGFDTKGVNSDPKLSNPISDFHLSSGSPAIGAGVGVGLSVDYAGTTVNSVPSIGAYESGSGTVPPPPPPPPPTAVPVYQNSAIANATPAILELTYDLSLNSSIIPAVSSFAAMVNSISVPVSAVVISGAKVQLTLSSAVKYGDIITVGYTNPATNPLQTVSGGIAANISTKAVTNNLIAPTDKGTTSSITMTLSPRYVHHTVNVTLQYTGTSTNIQALSPESLTITDSSGKLYVVKSLVTGVTYYQLPLNLKSGVYYLNILSNSVVKVSKRMIVY